MTRLGQTIEHARVAGGLSQDQLAELMAVTQPTISSWESGKTKPLPKRFPELSRALGIPVEELQQAFFADDSEKLLQHDSEIRTILDRVDRLEAVIRRLGRRRPGPA